MRKDKAKPAKDGNNHLRNDVIFIASLLLIVFIAGLCLYLFSSEGDTVVVTVDGQVWDEFSLSEDTTVNIETDHGTNVLVIRDKTAYIESASCPDGICSSHRAIRLDGESIICLPNKVVVTVKAQQNNHTDITV